MGVSATLHPLEAIVNGRSSFSALTRQPYLDMVVLAVRMHRKFLLALFANPGLRGVLLLCAATAHAATPDFFATRLYPVLDKAGCKYCHYSDGVASATRLHFPADGASIQMIEEFGRSLVEVVDRAEPEKRHFRSRLPSIAAASKKP